MAHSPTDGSLGGVSAALQIQGALYVWSYGMLNVLTFAVAAIALHAMVRKGADAGSWLVYNWALYVSLFWVLFPWLGGYP